MDWYKPENMKAGLAKQIKRLEKQRGIMHASNPTSWEYEKACTSMAGATSLIAHYRNYLRRHGGDDSPASK